jgi:hypothetical protein
MRRGERGVGIRPQPFGAPAKHCVAMFADHAVEHRHPGPFRASLPEPRDQRGIGLSTVVRGCEPHFAHGWSACRPAKMSQQACDM